MHRYFAQFIPGFGTVVEREVKKDIPGVEIINMSESGFLFTANCSYEEVLQRKYFTNAFLVLGQARTKESSHDKSVIQQLDGLAEYADITGHLSGVTLRTFRVMAQKGSKLVHVPRAILRSVVSTIGKTTDLTYSPSGADVEVWFLLQNIGMAYLGIKYTQLPKPYQNLRVQKGELRPRIAHMLALLSRPSSEDIILDPFAGYGAIPYERVTSFPFHQCFLSDSDSQLVSFLTNRFSKKEKVSIHQADARDLSYLPDNSVTTIITDPPWGLYMQIEVDYLSFYQAMLREFARVLRKDGKMVVLTAQTEVFAQVVASHGLTISERYDTLVNGKKAGVFIVVDGPAKGGQACGQWSLI